MREDGLGQQTEGPFSVTLLALWYRKDKDDIYAIADSRLLGSTGTLTEHAPKFTTSQLVCYALSSRNDFSKQVLSRSILIGYAGSASVAFATIATLQAYLSSLTLPSGGTTPGMRDIGELAKRVLEENFRHFGALWQDHAKCDLVLFGYLPTDRALKAFHLSAGVADGIIAVTNVELPLVEQQVCVAFGSGSEYFMSELRKDIDATGNFHPFNLLQRIIHQQERGDIGGHIQVAIANKSSVILPHVLTPRPDRGEHEADVTFLGRDTAVIGKVGDCKVGKEAVGPDLATLLASRKKPAWL